MGSDTNVVIVTGRLGSDPEHKSTPSGTPLTTFRLAVNRWVGGKDGTEGREETSWLTVSCWQNLALRISDQARKGSRVLVEGRIQVRQWDDPDTGQKREATELVADRITILDRVAEPSVS